jgi:CIC family chloride channel protein
LNVETFVGYLILGIASAIVAYMLIYTFFKISNYFKALNVHPVFKPAIGGFLAGTVGMINPIAIGNAYGWIQMLLNGDFSYLTILKVLTGIIFSIVALSLTLGSGGSGGVFGPSLVIGGLTGASIYFFLNSAIGNFFDLQSMTIVGMVSTFAATARAPLSTIVLVAEMTGGYELLVPSIISVSIAHILSGEKSIFPSQVKKRVDSPAHMDEYKAFVLQHVKVKDVMKSPVITLSPDDTVLNAQRIMEKEFISGIPVVINDVVVGLITSSDVLRVDREKRGTVKVKEVMTKNPKCVTPDTTLFDTLDKFISKGFGRAPVVKDFSSMKLIGIITRADIGRFLASRG